MSTLSSPDYSYNTEMPRLSFNRLMHSPCKRNDLLLILGIFIVTLYVFAHWGNQSSKTSSTSTQYSEHLDKDYNHSLDKDYLSSSSSSSSDDDDDDSETPSLEVTEDGEPNAELLFNITGDREFDRLLDQFDLGQNPIPFLPNYKNPCWYELVDPKTAYAFNLYALLGRGKHIERYQEAFTHMHQILLDRKSPDTGLAWRLRCLPYFYVAGFSRCGSTDLMSAIASHPHTVQSFRKEVIYWNRMRYQAKLSAGIGGLTTSWSLAHKNEKTKLTSAEKSILLELPRGLNHFVESFDYQAESLRKTVTDADENGGIPYHPMVFGDGTPSYMWDFDSWPNIPVHKGLLEPRYTVADYIHAVTPDAKVIVTLRNPVDRLYSDFKAFTFYPIKTSEVLHNLVVQGIARFKECLYQFTTRACVYKKITGSALRLRIGIYHIYLQDWLKVFPKDQILIVYLDDLANNKRKVLEEVFNFLELDPMSDKLYDKLDRKGASNKALYERGVKPEPMWPKTRTLLENFYEPYDKKLAELLGKKGPLW